MIKTLKAYGASENILNHKNQKPCEMSEISAEEANNFLTKQTGGQNVFEKVTR